VRRLLVLAAVILAILLANVRVVRVTDHAMAPSLQPGDLLVLGPGALQPGDVALLSDPAEPDRRVLRRVVGLPGHAVRVTAGQLEVDGQRARIREMGRSETHLTLSENNRWLVQQRLLPGRKSPKAETVPPGSVWLLADARDEAVDSRWWGPVDEDLVSSKVWLRMGKSNAWRGSWALRAQDGPWRVPPPQ
jgi:signal peptidase I